MSAAVAVEVVDAAAAAERPRLVFLAAGEAAYPSPDGRWLTGDIAAKPGDIPFLGVWSKSGELLHLVPEGEVSFLDVATLRVDTMSEVFFLSLDAGGLIKVPSSPAPAVRGGHIATATDKSVRVISLKTGRTEIELPSPIKEQAPERVEFDGRYIAVAGAETAHVADLTTQRWIASEELPSGFGMLFDRLGRFFVTVKVAATSPASLLVVTRLPDGKKLLEASVPPANFPPRAFQLSDERVLVHAEGTLTFVDVARGLVNQYSPRGEDQASSLSNVGLTSDGILCAIWAGHKQQEPVGRPIFDARRRAFIESRDPCFIDALGRATRARLPPISKGRVLVNDYGSVADHIWPMALSRDASTVAFLETEQGDGILGASTTLILADARKARVRAKIAIKKPAADAFFRIHLEFDDAGVLRAAVGENDYEIGSDGREHKAAVSARQVFGPPPGSVWQKLVWSPQPGGSELGKLPDGSACFIRSDGVIELSGPSRAALEQRLRCLVGDNLALASACAK